MVTKGTIHYLARLNNYNSATNPAFVNPVSVFRIWQTEIERIASNKYDAGTIHDLVPIGPHDLIKTEPRAGRIDDRARHSKQIARSPYTAGAKNYRR
jgi:hypothetical protein